MYVQGGVVVVTVVVVVGSVVVGNVRGVVTHRVVVGQAYKPTSLITTLSMPKLSSVASWSRFVNTFTVSG